jgi:hypothetical protein
MAAHHLQRGLGPRLSPCSYRNGKSSDRRDVTEILAAPDHRRSLATHGWHIGTERDRTEH